MNDWALVKYLFKAAATLLEESRESDQVFCRDDLFCLKFLETTNIPEHTW